MKALVLIVSALFVRSCVCSAANEPGELAVVVNKSISLETVSSSDLRLMILGEKSKWPDGKAVVAVESSPESAEKALQLKAVLKMTDAALKRYYMQAAFTGKDIAAPRAVASSAALKQFVAHTPGAIGCILASEADDSIKVLKVDGAAPGEPSYKLH
jgi:phosphate transport system substrate-binding protein